MSSQSRIEIQGQAPFKQSGVYETQIAITDSKPSEDSIKNKQFSSLWRGNFHLRVKDGVFSQTIGSAENPLPSSINNLDKIWIVVTDLFSSLYTVFDVPLGKPTRQSKTETRTIPESPKTKRYTKSNAFVGATGPQGSPGDKGSPGSQGTAGDKGPDGIFGQPGDKGTLGDKGQPGDKGITGDKGVTGDKGDKGDKGIAGPLGDKGGKGPTGSIGEKGPTGIKGPLGPSGEKGPTGQPGDKGASWIKRFSRRNW